MAPSSEQELALDIGEGLTMAAIAWGDATAATRCLCVHGWMDNAGSFGNAACRAFADEAAAADGLGARLARQLGAYVVACDLLGHGRSSHLPGGLYSNTGWATQLLKFADCLGWSSPFVLIGHSMGQEIASMLAAAFPERISAFVMLDGCGPWVPDEEQREEWGGPSHTADALRGSISNWLKRDGHHATPRAFESYEDVLSARLENKFSEVGITRHAAAAMVRRGIRDKEGAEGAMIEYTHDPRVASELEVNRITEEQVCELVTRLPRSLCVMAQAGIGESESDAGAESDTPVKRFLRNRRHVFRDLEVEWVPGGHHAHLDTPAPGPIADAVARFISKQSKL